MRQLGAIIGLLFMLAVTAVVLTAFLAIVMQAVELMK